jgi:hypothetical protein
MGLREFLTHPDLYSLYYIGGLILAGQIYIRLPSWEDFKERLKKRLKGRTLTP